MSMIHSRFTRLANQNGSILNKNEGPFSKNCFASGNKGNVTPAFEGILQRSRTDLVLFDAGTSFANVLTQSARWVEVYRDPYSVAFVPATDSGRALSTRLAPAPVFAPNSTDPCAQLNRYGLTGTTA